MLPHPYLARLSLLERARHIVLAATTRRFDWTVVVYATEKPLRGDVVRLVAGVCPGTVRVDEAEQSALPRDEIFIVARARWCPLAAAALSIDHALFFSSCDEDGDVPDTHPLVERVAWLFTRPLS